jgi:hypothetical protein
MYATEPNMAGGFLQGNFGSKSTATLLQVIFERFHDFLDIFGCRILQMGHYVPIDIEHVRCMIREVSIEGV